MVFDLPNVNEDKNEWNALSKLLRWDIVTNTANDLTNVQTLQANILQITQDN